MFPKRTARPTRIRYPALYYPVNDYRPRNIRSPGPAGIENFCSQHSCNQFCSQHWKTWAGAKPRFQPVWSTTLTLDVAHVSVPHMRNRKFDRMKPSEIRFTQDTIKYQFQDGNSLEQTACQIAAHDLQKRDMPMITVVKYQGVYYSLDNRRLAVFRLLEYAGKLSHSGIKVEIADLSRRHHEFNKKFSTSCHGRQITVRSRNSVIGDSKEATTFPLNKIRSAGPSREMAQKEDAEFNIFLCTLVDE